jgi:hypothetical protein
MTRVANSLTTFPDPSMIYVKCKPGLCLFKALWKLPQARYKDSIYKRHARYYHVSPNPKRDIVVVKTIFSEN